MIVCTWSAPRLVCACILLVDCYVWTCVPAWVLWWPRHNPNYFLDVVALVWLWFGGWPRGQRRWWCALRSWSLVLRWQCIHIWPWWCTGWWWPHHSSLTLTLQNLIGYAVLLWVWIWFGVCFDYLFMLLFLFLFLFVLYYIQVVDLSLPIILLYLHMRYLNIHNKGQSFWLFYCL